MSYANSRLYDLAKAMLTVVEDRYNADGVPMPARRYVTAGAVAFDCEQIVVAFQGYLPGLPGAGAQLPYLTTGSVRSVNFGVLVVRCVPVTRDDGIAPSAPALDASGKELLTDAFLSVDALVQAHAAKTFDDFCNRLLFVKTDPAGPEGGLGGVLSTWEAQV